MASITKLTSISNPQRGEDCVLTFKVENAIKNLEKSELKFKYVPDRDMITDSVFHAWLTHMLETPWETLEHFAAEAMRQFYDSALPFYVQLTLSYTQPETKLKRKLYFVKIQPKHTLSEIIKEQL